MWAERRGSASYRAAFRPGGGADIDARACERLLAIALSRGGDHADLFFEYRAAGGWHFEDGILKSASRGVSMGMGVRVLVGEATGYAYTEDLAPEAMRRAAETAAQIARGGGGTAEVRLEPFPVPARYDIGSISIDADGATKRDLCARAGRAAAAFDACVVKAEASFAEEVREVLVASSDGRMAFDVQPLVRFSVRAMAERDGRRQEGSSGGGGRTTLGYFDAHAPEDHAREAARQAVAMLDARDAPAGEMEVVLGPGQSGILLHEAVGHGLEADFARKGTSRYSGQIGAVVASDRCTVVDDATIAQARGSLDVDDEGREPARTVLIEAGVLRGYLHDRLSARLLGVAATGNGRRESFACAPLPRMTNTVLLGGEDDPDDIVRSVRRGVYAKKFGGGQVDIGNGDFVFSLTESYLIEDGRLTAPLKGVNLVGNGPETLREVAMLGHDVEISDGIWTCGKQGQSVPVGVGCPTVKIRRITVGGTRVGR